MPPKKVQNDYKINFGDTWFAQATLTEKDLTTFEAWYADIEPDLDEWLTQSAGEGDKLALAYDLGNDTLVASITVRDKHSPAYGAVITSRSTSALDAIGLCLWKRFVFLDLDTLREKGAQTQRG